MLLIKGVDIVMFWYFDEYLVDGYSTGFVLFFLWFQTCWTLGVRLEHELLNSGLGQMTSWESVVLTHVNYWRPF